MAKFNELHKPVTMTIGTAFVAALSVANVAHGATNANPFAIHEVNNGYMQIVENDKDGKNSEGKCGGMEKGKKDEKGKEGKCGGAKKDKKEGKCGEGKCGGKK